MTVAHHLPSRRSVTSAAAWSVPTLAVAIAAPSSATSLPICSDTALPGLDYPGGPVQGLGCGAGSCRCGGSGLCVDVAVFGVDDLCATLGTSLTTPADDCADGLFSPGRAASNAGYTNARAAMDRINARAAETYPADPRINPVNGLSDICLSEPAGVGGGGVGDYCFEVDTRNGGDAARYDFDTPLGLPSCGSGLRCRPAVEVDQEGSELCWVLLSPLDPAAADECKSHVSGYGNVVREGICVTE